MIESSLNLNSVPPLGAVVLGLTVPCIPYTLKQPPLNVEVRSLFIIILLYGFCIEVVIFVFIVLGPLVYDFLTFYVFNLVYLW